MKLMTPLERKLLEALTRLGGEIASMRTSAPPDSDPKDARTWFGAFSEWRSDPETDAASFSWPNLDIVVEENHKVIDEALKAFDDDKQVREFIKNGTLPK